MRNVDWGKVLTVLTPVAAGLWAVWRWIAERRADRRSERNRLAAQYVSPFLFACQDLQSRLYNILCRGGLNLLALRPNAPEELLYLVAQYFAFEPLVLRYTPYGTDPKLLRLIERVRDGFASAKSEHDMDPWCIFRHQQRALGQFVLVHRHDEPQMALDVMPLTRFVTEIGNDDQAKAKSLRVEKALSSLKDVDPRLRAPGALPSAVRRGPGPPGGPARLPRGRTARAQKLLAPLSRPEAEADAAWRREVQRARPRPLPEGMARLPENGGWHTRGSAVMALAVRPMPLPARSPRSTSSSMVAQPDPDPHGALDLSDGPTAQRSSAARPAKQRRRGSARPSMTCTHRSRHRLEPVWCAERGLLKGSE
jgi:hypothetical protein